MKFNNVIGVFNSKILQKYEIKIIKSNIKRGFYNLITHFLIMN